MNVKVFFTVMRKWNSPEIKTVVTNDGISMSMSMDDFKTILCDKLWSSVNFTKGGFRSRMDDVVEEVSQLMKKETAKVAS